MRASVTRAAEGFDRRSFSVDEILRMQEAGIISGSDIVLAVEFALTSLPYDRGLKSRLYARHGVQEFGVVDAAARRTYVHRAPSGDGWTDVSEREPDDALTHPSLPGFSLKLADV